MSRDLMRFAQGRMLVWAMLQQLRNSCSVYVVVTAAEVMPCKEFSRTKWLSFGVCESLDATLRPYAQRPREHHLFTRDGCLGPRDARCLQPPCHVPFIKNCMLSATKAANRGQNGFQEESATPLMFLLSWDFGSERADTTQRLQRIP